MSEKQRPVCRYCGSDDITVDMPARWHFADQKWTTEGADRYDKTEYCGECQAETRLEWIDE